MTEQRRLLSIIAGQREMATKQLFKGVYTLPTLASAKYLVDPNDTNIFFVNFLDSFIAVYNTPVKCFVIDGLLEKPYPDVLTDFIDHLSDDMPTQDIPYPIVDREHSMILCLYFVVALATNKSYNSTVLQFERNNITENCHYLKLWFSARYK